MKRILVAVALLVGALAPSIASAHPLGNFTVNHYSRVEPAGDRIRVVYVLDMAEIPTFQEKPRIDLNPDAYADQRAEELRQNLHLNLNGAPTPLRLEQRSLSFPDGQGGLPTLRLEAVYSAELRSDASAPVDLVFRDDNDPSRIGWREIVARPGAAGTEFQRSSVPAEDVTHELRQYPDDLLNSPLNVREARLAFVPGAAAARPHLAGSGVAVLDRTRSAFAELANGAELTPAFILFALGVAVVLGAAHALQPGHGKTVVAAYLVGSRGTAKHALFLGATVTATHTAGVYALGVVTLFLSQYILPERLYPILEIVSGLLVVAIGIYLFGSRLLVALGLRRDHGHTHSHAGHTHDYGAAAAHGPDAGHTRHLGDHHHAHPHVKAPEDLVSASAKERAQRAGESHSHSHAGHTHVHGDRHHHDHAPTQSSVLSPQSSPVVTRPQSSVLSPQSSPVLSPQSSPSWRSLLALGVSGGLLPCPEALMVLLITIAAHRVLFGLLLIVAFSTGLAAVLVGFGLLLVFAKGFFSRLNLSSGLAPRVLPVMSALVIVIAGGVITAQALPQVL